MTASASMKMLLKFYAWYLPVGISLAGFIVTINPRLFTDRPIISAFVATAAGLLPVMAYLPFLKRGSLRKAVRLLRSSVLRPRVFVAVSSLVGLIATSSLLVSALSGGITVRVMTANLFAVDALLVYLIAMLISGKLAFRDLKDLLIQPRDSPAIYVYRAGQIHHIPDPATLRLLGHSFDDVFTVDDAELRSYRIGPPVESVFEAKLVQATGDAAIWMIVDGIRRWVPDPQTLQFCLQNHQRPINRVSPDGLLQWQQGPPLVSIVAVASVA